MAVSRNSIIFDHCYFFGKLKSGAGFVLLGPKLSFLSTKRYFSKMGLSPRKSAYIGNRIVFGGGSKGKVVAPSVLVIWPADKYYGPKQKIDSKKQPDLAQKIYFGHFGLQNNANKVPRRFSDMWVPN